MEHLEIIIRLGEDSEQALVAAQQALADVKAREAELLKVTEASSGSGQ